MISRRSLLQLVSAAAMGAARPSAAQPSAFDWGAVRASFPVTARPGVYLDTAYIGPIPADVVRMAAAFTGAKAQAPFSLPAMQARADEVRAQFARLVNATPDEVGFVAATSEGENLVARALDLQPGDNVVIDELHYQAEFVLYKRLEETKKIQLRIAPQRGGAVTRADFEPLVDRRTRLISVALVSHQNGYRHELKSLADLAHVNGAWLYTDAIQAAGAIAIDVRAADVDALCTGTYKWLHAGFGVAPFYVRRDRLDRFALDRYGALHVARTRPGYRFDIHETAKKFEYATLAFGAVYELGASLEFLSRIGVPRIEEHVCTLAARLNTGLRARGFDVLTPEANRSPIVAFRVPGDPSVARAVFQKAEAQVSFRENGTQIRVSPALFNTEQEIDALLGVAEQLRPRRV
jgi:selenocysteine lyase/cysteine desulfurase